MQLRTKLTALIAGIFLSTALFAQSSESGEKPSSNSPYFAKVGRTIFVSGPAKWWVGQLTNALPSTRSESAMREYNADPAKQVDLIVFVNATSSHPESTGASDALEIRMRGHNVSTKVLGGCDMFCTRLFTAGKTREFGQDLEREPVRLLIQVPVNYEKKLMDRRFPNTQIASYERLVPDFVAKHRDLLVRGFTQPIDTTGGLNIGPNDVKYCASSESSPCEDYVGLDAFKMGLTTSQERIAVVLPDRFPAPLPSGFAAVDDFSKLPFRGEKAAERYKAFLAATSSEDRLWAIPEKPDYEGFAGAWGSVQGKGAAERVLSSCEERSRSKCRIYLAGNDVVW